MAKGTKKKPEKAPEAEDQAIRPPAPENPWDRRPKESRPAYEAFREYLLQGADRSTANVARGLGKSKTLIDRWSSTWSWVARTDAFDAEAGKRATEATLDELEQRARRQAELSASALEAMAAPSLELLRRIEKDPKVLEKLSVEALVPLAATTARAIPRVVQTERLASGQSTSNVGGSKGGPLEIEDMARAEARRQAEELPDEQLVSFLAGAAAGAAAAAEGKT